MSVGLREWLAREGVLGEATLRAAVERQLVYGGGLDTALLERGDLSEATLWPRLVAASGFPAPPPSLCDWLQKVAPPLLPADVTGPLRAVPVAAEGTTLDLLCAVPVAAAAIRAAARERGFVARLYVVLETRLLAMRERVYGEPLPSRHAPLLVQAVGAAPPRRARSTVVPARLGQEQGSASSSPPPPGGVRAPYSPSAAVPLDGEGSTADHHQETPGPCDGSRGPLEHFLDLSGPLSTSEAGRGGGDDAIAELEVEMEIDLRVDWPPGACPTEAVPEAVVSGPARLEVVSSLPGAGAGARGAPESEADFATEALCRRARDTQDKGRMLALRALRQRMDHAATQGLLDELRAVAADVGRGRGETISALDALAELRDGTAIPAMIERLAATSEPSEKAAEEVAQAAHRALVAVCAQDFGRSRRRWQAWARDHGAQSRVDWLIEGLAHKQTAIRTAAFEELRHLAGDSFGYHPRSPKNERERARRRFADWWRQLHERRQTGISGRISAPADEQRAFLAPGEEAPLPPTPKAR